MSDAVYAEKMTGMRELGRVLVLLVELYTAIIFMHIGFGMMLGGKVWAQRVARFCFLRPFARLSSAVRYRARQILALVRHVMIAYLVLPIVHALWITPRRPAGCRRRLAVTLGLIVHCAFNVVALAAVSPVTAQSISVRAQRHNIFRTDVTLNNRVTARALIDTGASSLSMCSATANALHLKLGDGVRLATANGIIPARLAKVASVRIGPIEVRNVEAVVKADGSRCDDGLLIGMSVLRKLHVSLMDDTLILAARRPADAVGGRNPWALLIGAWIVLLISVVGVHRQRSRLSSRLAMENSPRTGASLFR